MRNPSLRLLCVAVVSCLAVLAFPARASGPSVAGVAVGFARVNLGDGTVAAWGGRGTRSVTTGPSGDGWIVFFNGVYPKKLTSDTVVVQATADATAGQFAVANANVTGVDSSQIVVTVNGWLAGTTTPITGYVFLTLYAGEPPKQ